MGTAFPVWDVEFHLSSNSSSSISSTDQNPVMSLESIFTCPRMRVGMAQHWHPALVQQGHLLREQGDPVVETFRHPPWAMAIQGRCLT